MKTLSEKFIGCNCKLYKVGFLIGFTYLMPNLIIAVLCFRKNYDSYFTLPFLSIITVITSMLLIKALMQDHPYYLLPWMLNIGILIFFNFILFAVQFHKFNSDYKFSFYLELIYLIGLGVQILGWYCICFWREKAYLNSKVLIPPLETISEDVGKVDNKGFYNLNLSLNAGEEKTSDNKILQV
ncbi:uncharacterized protein ACRADG_010297 [Cochliomyia hominivorax]